MNLIMIHLLFEPLTFTFMQNALIMIVLLGGLCAVTGSYLIVQRMGLLGDVIAHAMLPGLAIAYYLEINIFVGAFMSGMLSTIVMSWVQSQSRVKVDVVMALVFSGFLALGIALITLLESQIDLHGFLFGDILAVTQADILRTLEITASILLFVKLFYKELLFYTFNPLGAKAMGLPITWLNLGLISAISLTIIASMQAVGVVLVISLLVGPSITAYLFVKELHQMMGLGAIFGSLSGGIGIYLSYYFNIPSGASIVLTVTGFFLMALLFSPSQGILTHSVIINQHKCPLLKLIKSKNNTH